MTVRNHHKTWTGLSKEDTFALRNLSINGHRREDFRITCHYLLNFCLHLLFQKNTQKMLSFVALLMVFCHGNRKITKTENTWWKKKKKGEKRINDRMLGKSMVGEEKQKLCFRKISQRQDQKLSLPREKQAEVLDMGTQQGGFYRSTGAPVPISLWIFASSLDALILGHNS